LTSATASAYAAISVKHRCRCWSQNCTYKKDLHTARCPAPPAVPHAQSTSLKDQGRYEARPSEEEDLLGRHRSWDCIVRIVLDVFSSYITTAPAKHVNKG